MIRKLAIALGLLTLPACGLRPVYGGGTHGAVATVLSSIEVATIPDKAGWMMRNALTDRLRAAGPDTPRYRLQVTLDDRIDGFGVRKDNVTTRERRTLRARYQLVEAATNAVVLDATAASDAGIDVVSSEYSVIAAENTALENLTQDVADQIIARLARYASSSA
ncbi:LPS assembly lipoprotein LptE [Sphingomonas sp. ID0503]|uniref:LPS assembly lipoprotein LptE n=1 Tax=Sphingomonas sp. ID0503 TaxID=3399691 RepID=UPI003AFAB364